MAYCEIHDRTYGVKCRDCESLLALKASIMSPADVCPIHGPYEVFCRECDSFLLLKEGIPIPGYTYSVCDAHLRFEGKGMDLSCEACDRAALNAAGLPLTYTSLTVTPVPSNKKDGKVVAFLGKQLCFFENDVTPPPRTDQPIEVMLTRVLYRTKPEGGRDWQNLLAIVLRPIDHDKHVLIHHRGFECSGSMCQTTATPRSPGLNGKMLAAFITPGRTDVWVAENVNRSFATQERIAKRPGMIWVNKADLKNGGKLRAEGIARVEDAIYYKAVRR